MAVHVKTDSAHLRPCAVFNNEFRRSQRTNQRSRRFPRRRHWRPVTVGCSPFRAVTAGLGQVAKRWCSTQRFVRSVGRRFSPLQPPSAKPARRSCSVGFLRGYFVHSTLNGAVIDPMRPLRLSRTTMRTVYSPAARSSAPRNPTPFSLTFVSSSGEG